MRKKALRWLTTLTLLTAAFSITAWAVSLVGWQGNSQATQEARREERKTLRELAQERDVESEVPDMEFNLEYGDLRTLARNAHAVVIGRITKEESAFDGDDSIFTSYSVDVRRVVKDKTSEVVPLLRLLGEQETPAPLVTPLKVGRAGGAVYVNGHRASKKLKGSEALKVGRDYVFFLWWSRELKAYHIMGGVSGAFAVENESRAQPLGSEKGMVKYHGMSLEALIEEVLTAQ